MERPTSPPPPWRAGLRSARAHLVPGIVLQVLALVLVVSYYRSPLAHAALARLMDVRRSAGVGFGMATTALFGGFLPYVYMRCWRDATGVPRYNGRQGLCLAAFWAYKGLEVDLFYRLMAHIFGPGHDPATILRKALVDQFIYCPVLAVPVMVIVYSWMDDRFRLAGVASDLRTPGWYARRVFPLLISNFGVWAPAVAIIYALPTPLQLPLQNIVLCFYTLLIAHQTRPRPAHRT
jgi:hypothetical protein